MLREVWEFRSALRYRLDALRLSPLNSTRTLQNYEPSSLDTESLTNYIQTCWMKLFTKLFHPYTFQISKSLNETGNVYETLCSILRRRCIIITMKRNHRSLVRDSSEIDERTTNTNIINTSQNSSRRDFSIFVSFEKYLNLRLMRGSRFETVAKLRARV